MSVRHDLAAAVSTVETATTKITGHPYITTSLDPGTAFVRLDRIEYPDPFDGVVHWNVVIVLPQDLAAAEVYVEQIVQPVREALTPHLTVTSVAPRQLAIPKVGTLPTLIVTGHREEADQEGSD